jgi:hypothetical protein
MSLPLIYCYNSLLGQAVAHLTCIQEVSDLVPDPDIDYAD